MWSSLWFLRVLSVVALLGWAQAEWRAVHPVKPPPATVHTGTSSSAATTAKASTVLSSANLVVTAEGGTTTIDLAEGEIRTIRNTGGKLVMSATLSSSRHESTTRSETSASSYTASTFQATTKTTWTWAVRAGAFFPLERDGGGSGLEFGLARKVARLDLWLLPPIDFGATIAARFPFGQYVPNGLTAGLLGTW